MKKIISSILIAIVILQIFAPFSVGLENKKLVVEKNVVTAVEAKDCKITSARLNTIGGTTKETAIKKPNPLIIDVKTENCVGNLIQLDIKETNFVNAFVFQSDFILMKENNYSFILKPGEEACNSGFCEINYNISVSKNRRELSSIDSSQDYTYKCDSSSCDDTKKWSINREKPKDPNATIGYKFDVSSVVQTTDTTAVVKSTIKDASKTENSQSGIVSNYTNIVIAATAYKTNTKDVVSTEKQPLSVKDDVQTFTLKNLKANTDYDLVLSVIESVMTTTSSNYGAVTSIQNIELFSSPIKKIHTNPEGKTELSSESDLGTLTQDTLVNKGSNSKLPACGFIGIGETNGTFMGCVAQGLYYLFFKTTSFVFGLTGKILDFTLMYSIQDSSYRSEFIESGWGIVRDFCNMFFIFVLLYIAIGTILNLHSVKTKEMIINVVIIGLLMNFSLFAARVVIDASNVLTRVFYNQNTIVTGVKDPKTGLINNQLGEFGEIKLSEAIVSKVDPQKLILESQKIQQVQIRGTVAGEEGSSTNDGITTGSFILIVFLATAVNIVGIIAFLTCGIIFIARVIGLWLAMILVPLAFFSYTVPALSDMKMVGWKHWWPDTLKLAFLAPIFAFFMYIIVGFMSKGLGVMSADGQTGLNFVVAIVVPFVFIMILLMKAKSIANDLSGEIGQSITGAVKAVGGLALGGAALGGAMLGRQVIGKGLAAASRTESAQHFANAKIAHNKELEKWEANGGKKSGVAKPVFVAPKGVIRNADGSAKKDKNGKEIKYNAFTGRLGGNLNAAQNKVGNVDKARHEWDEAAKAANVVGKDGQPLSMKEMSGEDVKKVEAKFKQTKQPAAETAAMKGVNAKGDEIKLNTKDSNGNDKVFTGADAFRSGMRKDVSDSIMDNPEDGDVVEETKKVKTKTKKFNPSTNLYEEVEEEKEVGTGKKVLSQQGQKKLEDQLNIKLNAAVKIAADKEVNHELAHVKEGAATKVNPLTRSFAGANKNSYDVRDIANMKSDRRESFGTKATVGLVAAVAAGVRGGIKGIGMSNTEGGIKTQGDFFKDLGSVITDSMKSAKVNVHVADIGGHKSSADAHGGDAHGGGHH